jgi:hypothetical protein
MKATKLTIPENGKRIWREDAFEGGVMSRADLRADFKALGFKLQTGKDWGEDLEEWELHLPKSIKPYNDEMSFLWVNLDLSLGVSYSDPTVGKVVDGKIMEFSSDTLVGVHLLQHNSKAYMLKDMWQGIRQQWEKLCHYDACCKGEHKVEKLVKYWDIA